MPVRRKYAKRPSVIFINAQGKYPDKLALQAARQHAAYWSQALRRQGSIQNSDSATESLVEDRVEGSDDSALDIHSSRLLKKKECRRRNQIPQASQTESNPQCSAIDFSLGAKLDVFQVLPHLQCKPNTLGDLKNMEATMFKFFGKDFVRNILLRDSEHAHVMLAGCLLLHAAYQFAITGKGSRVKLMELKGEVIRAVNGAISTVEGHTRLETLVAVLILGMPIICLVTNQMPRYLAIEEDVVRAEQRVKLDSTTSHIMEEATGREYETHYAAVTRLLHFHDDLESFLATYEGRFVLINKMLSSAHRLISEPRTPHDAWIYVYGKLDQYIGKGVTDPAWFSPLYCPFGKCTTGRPARNMVEAHLLIVVQGVHNWMATFANPECSGISQIEDRYLRRQELQKLLASGPSIFDQPCMLFSNSIYIACIVTIEIMLEVEERQLSLCHVAEIIPKALKLPELLRQTDLVNMWGDFKGLLYWVTTICHVTAPRSHLRLTSTTVLACITQIFATSDCIIDAAIRPLQMLLCFDRSNMKRGD